MHDVRSKAEHILSLLENETAQDGDNCLYYSWIKIYLYT